MSSDKEKINDGVEEPENEATDDQSEGAQEAAETETDQRDAEIEKLKKELDEQKELYLRLAAEYDNYRKRTIRERDDIRSDARAGTVEAMLGVADNFERAMKQDSGSHEDFRKGIEMVFNQWREILGKLRVEEFGAVGDEFDPSIHHAVIQSDDEEAEENSITDVLQKGYRMGDKIIRPAMVAVKS